MKCWKNKKRMNVCSLSKGACLNSQCSACEVRTWRIVSSIECYLVENFSLIFFPWRRYIRPLLGSCKYVLKSVILFPGFYYWQKQNCIFIVVSEFRRHIWRFCIIIILSRYLSVSLSMSLALIAILMSHQFNLGKNGRENGFSNQLRSWVSQQWSD